MNISNTKTLTSAEIRALDELKRLKSIGAIKSRDEELKSIAKDNEVVDYLTKVHYAR